MIHLKPWFETQTNSTKDLFSHRVRPTALLIYSLLTFFWFEIVFTWIFAFACHTCIQTMSCTVPFKFFYLLLILNSPSAFLHLYMKKKKNKIESNVTRSCVWNTSIAKFWMLSLSYNQRFFTHSKILYRNRCQN